ncbi:hypothetical protein H5410_022618 [Solanum commersonii]|uniref:Uncharacterized protein n=1 Tax=Solanum commersonii TaxID=4109 RepID=A0A9J5ZEM4_SOLCO|nr:hypothetical protein H5410_022618 [Solanum commersonii]
METQAFTNPILVKFQPKVDQYEEMEKDVKAKASDDEAVRNFQTTRGNKSLEYKDLCVQPAIDLPVGCKLPKFDTFNGIDVSAVMIDQARIPGQVPPYLNQPHQPIYPYQYGEASHALYHPPSTPYHVYKTQANYYQPRAPTYNKPHSYQPLQASTFQNRPYVAPRAPLIEVTAATSYMPLYNSETSTIWGAEPGETLKNLTCTPSLVRRESW